MKKIVFGLK